MSSVFHIHYRRQKCFMKNISISVITQSVGSCRIRFDRQRKSVSYNFEPELLIKFSKEELSFLQLAVCYLYYVS